MEARIIAVADTFDAMTSTRSYRSARSTGEAIRIIREVAGTQLDPAPVGAFLMAQGSLGSILEKVGSAESDQNEDSKAELG